MSELDKLDYENKPKGNVILATEEVKKERLAICKNCEHYSVAANLLKMCDQCGCILQWKTWIKDIKCPKDKW